MRIVRASFVALAALLVAPSLLAEDAKPPADRGAARARGKRKTKDAGPEASFPGFQMLPAGGSRVFVDVSRKVEVTEHVSPGLVTYALKGVHLDSGNDQNPLETYYYNTPVVRARLKRVKVKKDNEVDLVIQTRGDAQPTFRVVEQKGGSMRLEVDFPAGTFATDKDPPPPPVTDKKIKLRKTAATAQSAGTPKVKGPKP